MTYSCARFAQPDVTLDDAQTAKHDLDLPQARAARAPRRAPARRRLRLGIDGHPCRAALRRTRCRHHDQQGAGRARPAARRRGGCRRSRRDPAAGLPRPGAASRSTRSPRSACRSTSATTSWTTYFDDAPRCARPAGSAPQPRHLVGRRLDARPTSFVGRYVFPDGELIDVGDTVLAMERAGFEVRDVESLREHYARTLRCWVANLESNWDEAVDAGRRAAGEDLAAVHGRLGRRLRGRWDRDPPGARCRPERDRQRRRCRPPAATGLSRSEQAVG